MKETYRLPLWNLMKDLSHRVEYVRRGRQRTISVGVSLIHHAIADGWSWGSFVQDLLYSLRDLVCSGFRKAPRGSDWCCRILCPPGVAKPIQ